MKSNFEKHILIMKATFIPCALCPKNINFQASTDKKFLAWNLETTVVIDILIRNCWQATLRPPCPFQPLGSPARPVFNCSWVNGEVPWAKVILSRQIITF